MMDWEDCTTLKWVRELSEEIRRRNVTIIIPTKAPPMKEPSAPTGPRFIDYLGLLPPRPRGKLTDQAILQVLRSYSAKYSEACEESVRRNRHMNECSAETTVPADAVKEWLLGFSAHFATRYDGGRKAGDVMFGMAKCAKTWRTRPGLESVDQKVRDAVIVDFVNYVAGNHCGMDFGMYTSDLGKPEAGDEAYA